MELGTGCLKVTPGHDFNDFEIGKRHNLEIINILNKDGTLNSFGLEWEGQSCKKARPSFIEKLKEDGVLVDIKKHVHQVGHGDRSKAVIEPMVSKQWFLNIEDMAASVVKAVETEETNFWRNNGRTPTFHGFETQETGVYHVSSGGDIKSQYFTVKTVIINGQMLEPLVSVQSAVQKIFIRILTYWILGLVLVFAL